MERVVTTLPISVPEDPKLSIWVSPYIAKLIEKHSDLTWSLLATNLLGQKVEGIDQSVLEERLNSFKTQLEALWISPEHIWIDKDNIESLLSVIDNLKEKWLIQEKDVTIKICDCWTYESLSQAWNFWSKKNIQKDEVCSKCWSTLKEKQVKGLMYTIEDKDYAIYPNRYQGHIKNYKNNYSEILISRERDTWVNYQWYNIDIDFLWSMWLVDLKKKWYLPEVVLTNPSWLYNTYIAMSIYKALGEDPIVWVVHPYIWINSNDKEIATKWLKHPNYSLETIINNEQWDIMKILLATWLKWWEDYSMLNESSKKTINKLLNALQTTEASEDGKKYSLEEMDELLKKIHWKNVLNALAGRIWNRRLTPEDQKEVLNNFII